MPQGTSEPAMTGAPPVSSAAEASGTVAFALPPGRPGLISSPQIGEGAAQRGGAAAPSEAGTPVVDAVEMRRLALEEAERGLESEMERMLPMEGLAEVAEICGEQPDVGTGMLAMRLAESLVDTVWTPLAGCKSTLRGLGADDVRIKLQLFWRCAVALCMMPLQHLALLTQRKRAFLHDLDTFLAPEGATAAETKFAHIRVNLPIFAMVAKYPTELQDTTQLNATANSRKPTAGDASTEASGRDRAPAQHSDIAGAPGAVVSVPVTAELTDTAALPPLGKIQSAAKHTYDIGYKRWEGFDADAAIQEIDSKAPPKTETVRLPTDSESKPGPDVEDPLQALDQAIAELREREAEGLRNPSEAFEGQPAEVGTPSDEASGAVAGLAESVEDSPEMASAGEQDIVGGTAAAAAVPEREQSVCPSEDHAADAVDLVVPEVSRGHGTKRDSTTAPGSVKSHTLWGQYRRWELFDAEQALQEASDDERGPTKSAPPSALSDQVRPARAATEPSRCSNDTSERPASSRKGVIEVPRGSASVATSRPEPRAARCNKGEVASSGEPAAEISETATVAVADKCEDNTAAAWQDLAAESSNIATAEVAGTGEGNISTALQEPAAEDSKTALAEIANTDEGSTAAALMKEYQKWETFDDVDELDGDDGTLEDASGLDLDALTGPEDEVAQIHAHWRQWSKRQARIGRDQKPKAEPKLKPRPVPKALPEGPVLSRPCEYRPPSDPQVAAAEALKRDYGKWKTFDADAALLELDNEGTTKEGSAMRCSVGTGSAMINTEGYTKDRDEYELDQDIEKHAGSLKKIVAQRIKDAAGFKAEGNALYQDRQLEAACGAYMKGIDTMDLCQQASVLMADSVASKQLRLVRDLHRNLAAAQLELKDFEGARESCDRALECSSGGKDSVDDEKALYRRAFALLHLGRREDARKDIERLASARGQADPAVRRLRALAAARPGAASQN